MTAGEQLGAQLRSIRNGAGISLRALARMTEIPATTIEGYEKGNKIPADKFLLLADALDHHTFAVDGQEFTVGRSVRGAAQEIAEQMRLNFLGEYTYSKASVRIGPGRITVSFDASKPSGLKKSPSR
jgi:transcriptional regulator with XRE-family HTH domain